MMSRPRFQRDDPIMLSITRGIDYDFNSPEALVQHPLRTPEPGEPQASNKWKRPTLGILSVSNPWRNTILGTSCVIAVLLDPLFFYIPYIKEEEKCMGIDKQVQTAAMVSRSITDINFLVHIFYQLRETSKFAASKILRDTNSDWEWKSVSRDQMIRFAKAFSSKLSWSCFLTDSLAVLPIPQVKYFLVLMVAVFFKMKGPRYLEDRKAVSFFILVQYLPRMYRIYIWSTEIRLLFGLKLHSIYSCTSLPVIYLEHFGTSFRFYDDFGTSLETSTYVWENFFAILISVVGLILFSYLIGNMQQCMQWEEEKKAGVDKFLSMKDDIELWMERNELQEDMKMEIIKAVKKKIEDDVGFDATNMENLFSCLPWYTKRSLQRILSMSTIRTVPMLKNLDEKVLKMICDYLKPVSYADNTIVFGMGEPLDRMVFIAEGFMWTYTTAAGSGESMDTNFLKKGNSYGKELLQFAQGSSLNQLPTSAANVRCHSNVDAFVLMAMDLRSIVSICEKWWPFDYNASKDDAADQVAPLPRPFPQPRRRTSTSSTPPATDSGVNSP